MNRFDRTRLAPARQGLAASLGVGVAIGLALAADVSHGSDRGADGIRIAIAPFADGRFEVYVDDRLVHSKLETGQFPDPEALVETIAG